MTSHGVSSLNSGSSPLARGLRLWAMMCRGLVRIIPARAGFTTFSGKTRACRPDHPRSRGVYLRRGGFPKPTQGSSPLARGLQALSVSASAKWIIPARAGFTGIAIFFILRKRDHPRSRGVYRTRPRRQCCLSGSSPLARGLPGCGDSRRADLRIIPARAGFTGRRRF